MWNSPDALRVLSQVLTWGAFTFAVLAAVSTFGRTYVDRRLNELRAAERAVQEAALRAGVREAEDKAKAADDRARNAEARAGDADSKAASAARRADEAHAIANRHQPQALSPDVEAKVTRELSAVAKFPGFRLDLVLIGGGDPGVDHATATLSRLLTASGISLGNVATIGMAPGRPRGALVFADQRLEVAARALVRALKPLVSNVAFSVQSGANVTLSIHGIPAFNDNGSFAIE